VSAATPSPDGAATESFAALKRVKAAETEWAGKLASSRAGSDAALARLRDESAAALKAAVAEADQERAAAVQRARAEAEGLAATIVAEGAKAADAALRVEGKQPADLEKEILAVVLGAFAGD